MKKEHKEIIAGSVAALIIIVLICFVSFEKFSTFNFVRAGIGLAQIQLTDAEYTEIKDSPRIVLTKSENSREIFIKMIENEGYEYVEQMGSSHIIEKGDESEQIISSSNGYFTRWTWSN